MSKAKLTGAAHGISPARVVAGWADGAAPFFATASV